MTNRLFFVKVSLRDLSPWVECTYLNQIIEIFFANLATILLLLNFSPHVFGEGT